MNSARRGRKCLIEVEEGRICFDGSHDVHADAFQAPPVLVAPIRGVDLIKLRDGDRSVSVQLPTSLGTGTNQALVDQRLFVETLAGQVDDLKKQLPQLISARQNAENIVEQLNGQAAQIQHDKTAANGVLKQLLERRSTVAGDLKRDRELLDREPSGLAKMVRLIGHTQEFATFLHGQLDKVQARISHGRGNPNLAAAPEKISERIAAVASHRSQINALDRQIQEVRADLRRLTGNLGKAQAALIAAQKQAEKADQELAVAEGELSRIQTERQSAEAKLADLESQLQSMVLGQSQHVIVPNFDTIHTFALEVATVLSDEFNTVKRAAQIVEPPIGSTSVGVPFGDLGSVKLEVHRGSGAASLQFMPAGTGSTPSKLPMYIATGRAVSLDPSGLSGMAVEVSGQISGLGSASTVTALGFLGPKEVYRAEILVDGLFDVRADEGLTSVLLVPSNSLVPLGLTSLRLKVDRSERSSGIPLSPLNCPELARIVAPDWGRQPQDAEYWRILRNYPVYIPRGGDDRPINGRVLWEIGVDSTRYTAVRVQIRSRSARALGLSYLNALGIHSVPSQYFQIIDSQTVLVAPGVPNRLFLDVQANGHLSVTTDSGDDPSAILPPASFTPALDIFKFYAQMRPEGVMTAGTSYVDAPSALLFPNSTVNVFAGVGNEGRTGGTGVLYVYAGYTGDPSLDTLQGALPISLGPLSQKWISKNITVPSRPVGVDENARAVVSLAFVDAATGATITHQKISQSPRSMDVRVFNPKTGLLESISVPDTTDDAERRAHATDKALQAIATLPSAARFAIEALTDDVLTQIIAEGVATAAEQGSIEEVASTIEQGIVKSLPLVAYGGMGNGLSIPGDSGDAENGAGTNLPPAQNPPAGNIVPRVIDRRNRSDESGNYAIAFGARSISVQDLSPTGHAFVALYKADASLQASTVKALGFFPEKGFVARSIFKEVPGNIIDDAIKNRGKTGNEVLLVRVNLPQWLAVQKVMEEWDSPTSGYRLVLNDCVSFVDAVASAIGLTTPDRGTTDRPAMYVGRLAEMNR